MKVHTLLRRYREVFRKLKNDVIVYDGKCFHPIMFTDTAAVMGFDIWEKTISEMDGYVTCAHIICEIACLDDGFICKASGRSYTDDEKAYAGAC